MAAEGRAQGGQVRAASDIAAYLHQVLNGYRMYERSHTTLQTLEGRLHETLTSFLDEYEELQLEVTSSNLSLQGKPLDSEGRLESIARPLFLDGVQRVCLLRGIPLDEMTALTRVWFETSQGHQVEHSFTTRCWEEDFGHLRLVSVETFAEQAEGDERADGEKVKADELQALLDAVSNERLADDLTTTTRPKMMRVTAGDLVVFKMAGFAELTAADLQRHDSAERPKLAALEDTEAGNLARAVTEERAARVERFLRSASRVLLLAHKDEQHRFSELVTKLFGALVAARRCEEIVAPVRRLQQAGELDFIAAAAVEWLRKIVESPAVLPDVVRRLDDPPSRDGAASVLRLVRPESVGELIGLVDTLQSVEGAAALCAIIRDSGADISALSERVAQLPATLFQQLVSMLPGAQARQLLTKGLSHPDPATRRVALDGLGREAALAERNLLYGLVADPDPTIRQTAVRLLLGAKDEYAVPALAHLLRSGVADAAERKTIVVALGTLGGEHAGQALRDEFVQQKDPDLRAGCALALGRMGDESARPLLQSAAKKLLGNRTVRDACREALRRLDQAAGKQTGAG